jgi:hypothetical protein
LLRTPTQTRAVRMAGTLRALPASAAHLRA